MSVYSIKYNKALGTEFIEAKTKEIPTCPKLLSRLNIKDIIVTFDALNIQEKTINYINGNKGHYVVPTKDNHKDFAEESKTYSNDNAYLNKAENILKQKRITIK